MLSVRTAFQPKRPLASALEALQADPLAATTVAPAHIIYKFFCSFIKRYKYIIALESHEFPKPLAAALDFFIKSNTDCVWWCYSVMMIGIEREKSQLVARRDLRRFEKASYAAAAEVRCAGKRCKRGE